MKPYPSIRQGTVGQKYQPMSDAYIFDKLDGRNVRVEWTKKRGWSKWGSRHRLFDGTDPDFAPAIPLFEAIYAESLAKIGTDCRWDGAVAFLELHQGFPSLGGVFDPSLPFQLTLFDIAPFKECIMGPKEFLKTFADIVPTAKFLGQANYNAEFIGRVRDSTIDGVTLEGIVAKSGTRHTLDFAKAKTQKWIDLILARYGADEGQKLVES